MSATISARLCTAAMLLAAAAAAGAAPLPAEIAGEPIRREFDGRSDDLLSAGLGPEGLRGPAPAFADPLAPTALELRRHAIWSNYRALADETEAGGFGRLSGPRPGERIRGIEYLAAVRKPSGAGITTAMLQIPAAFDPAKPCLVAVAASGSRGIYGALPTAGEWGLRRGCAVVHTDKGAGTGFFDLDSATAWRIDLTATTDANDPLVLWHPPETPALAAWRRSHPHRLAVRHAHDGGNVERDWGLYLLQAVKVGFRLLQREYPQAGIARARTLVIASGVSNGGGAVLRAVEADHEGLLDGAVVSEPNVWLEPGPELTIRMGGREPVRSSPRSLLANARLHYLLQPVAVLAPTEVSAMTAIPEARRPALEAWAAQLTDLVFAPGETTAQRAQGARARLEGAGILREAQDGGIANVLFGIWPAIAQAYTGAYARSGPADAACGVSYAAVGADFRARALTAAELAKLAAESSGIPPTAGTQLVDEDGAFASFGSIGHLLCLEQLAADPRTHDGIAETLAAAKTGGKPVVIVHGRRDALIPVNFSSRAWYGRNLQHGGRAARYYEVEHGHHFDAFNAFPGWGERFVPLQPQLLAAMDLMYAHLTAGAPLPPSQVVRSRTRALVDGVLEPITPGHLGEIRPKPGRDAIRFRRDTLYVPE
jgi:hydroxybutyrate-dimer hydrolase